MDAYNTSLTKSTPTELSCKRCGHAAASVGGYALFAGGASSYNLLGFYENLVSAVDAYDASLTRSAAHIIGATVAIGGAAVGNYALFAGGTVYSQINEDNVTSDVLAYDPSLTFTTAPWLSVARANVKGASAGNYALFAGGRADGFCTTVDAYNASLTRTTATALSSTKNNSAAATVGNHAIFVGNTASADIYEYTNKSWDTIIVLSETTDEIRNHFSKEVKHWYYLPFDELFPTISADGTDLWEGLLRLKEEIGKKIYELYRDELKEQLLPRCTCGANDFCRCE